MTRFCVSDEVRVVGLSSSQWRDRIGIIVDIVEYCPDDEHHGMVQECAVQISGDLCWFMARHLVKTAPGKLIRFYRAEVLDRWPLDPADVDNLSGEHEELVLVLCNHLGLGPRRAEAEINDFYSAFKEKIALAIGRKPENGTTQSAA